MPTIGNYKVICILVGLPARGKSYISQKVCRYLNWLGLSTRVFNVGAYRRAHYGAHLPHSFFDYHNTEALAQRQEAASHVLNELLDWLSLPTSNVAIYDATNSTRSRRKHIYNTCVQSDCQPHVMFIESICNNADIVMENVTEVKLKSPDYEGEDDGVAVSDFMERIKHYEEVYEEMDPEEEDALQHATCLKLIDVGSQVIVHRILGHLESRIIYYLMNLHIEKRKIFLSRHGESMFNVEGKIGGDALLSPRGAQYGKVLPTLIHDALGDEKLTVWTSTLRRTIQTGELLPYPKLTWKALDEINAGQCDGMMYEEIEQAYPEDYANRDQDKFNYRYRGGESYKDVVLRLEPVIMELERQHNILIIGHQAILRCLYAYFHNYSQEELPYIRIPLHTLIRLEPKAYGCEESRFKADIAAVDTHRPKPTG